MVADPGADAPGLSANWVFTQVSRASPIDIAAVMGEFEAVMGESGAVMGDRDPLLGNKLVELGKRGLTRSLLTSSLRSYAGTRFAGSVSHLCNCRLKTVSIPNQIH